MALYPIMVITQLGKNLYAKAQSGIAIKYTRMRIGSGSYSGDPSTLTNLVQPIGWVPIYGFSRTGATAHVKGRFENTDVTQSTYSCEIGIYAEDPDLGEILYGYSNAGTKGDYIPPISAGPFSREFQVNIAVGSASQVTAIVSPSGFVSYEEFNEHVQDYSNPHKTTYEQVGAAAKDHTHLNATTIAAGFMSASDKSKLDGIQTQAINKGTADTLYAPLSHVGTGGSAHALATSSAAGFMSSEDKDGQQSLRKYRSGYDTGAQIYTTVEYKRKDGTLFMKSVLSSKVGNNYTVDTRTFYATNGTTIRNTEIWDITYDANGNPVNEVLR
ncbi:hypothetical protein [Brevibacillus sp. MER 51]|uniref:hypothetical protein n=1 Tax=Brevibacillus sp. MER 51 TaxID=2939560 RepID=UPI00203DE973|nr:hypothetical protein [Brevibacillus sp. MER 51]MCM3141648.1 hypothetical protein [Brevibacillus sp. MER 51]